MKIMIVEDDPVSLALLKKALGKTESTIITAKDGAEAWEMFESEHPRIVLSDWMLPKLSGIEVCHKIRESRTPAYIYIIIMTAKDHKEDVLAAFDAGADDYVAKPYDIRELHARVNTGKRLIQLEDTHQALQKKLKKISSELIKKNVKLENVVKNLERTQAQMLQSEKMASIGQLAAGVAHEINNPTGFVSSNLKTLGDYQQDMNQLLEDYQKLKATLKKLPEEQLPASINELISQVEATEQDVDIEYIKEDVEDLIGDCREGTERIKKIVDDLKHFAHPGEDKMKETDINAGIESTLNVVNNELKYKATIVKELGEVPIIHAYPQQLNQVFMNIMVNAAQAIEKMGEIKITTTTVDGKVEIRISDTGCGIAEEDINKIFDPFFTTKEVGKGTGLGMNIAYNIVSKHKGDIRVESTIGKGTTFIIQLPVGSPPKGEAHSSTEQLVA
jgi:signal transduction histidine kinase